MLFRSPPYLLVSGNLARPVNLNMVGLRRNGFGRESLQAMKRVYKLLFHGHSPLDDVIGEISGMIKEHGELQPFLEFMELHRESKAGIIRAGERKGG